MMRRRGENLRVKPMHDKCQLLGSTSHGCLENLDTGDWYDLNMDYWMEVLVVVLGQEVGHVITVRTYIL